MSERAPHHEKQHAHEIHEHAEHNKDVHEHLAKKAEQAKQALSEKNIDHIRELAKAHAEESHKTKLEHSKDIKSDGDDVVGLHQSLKDSAYDRTLRTIQQRLPKSARVFSKVTHNKTIEAVSNVGARTVARPSGLLGGGICAFLGSVIFLYYAKHYGFTYNYSLLFLLFVGGFVAGAIIELLVWVLYGRRHRF